MSRALVVGASGQVGHHLLASLRSAGEAALGTYHATQLSGLVRLDIRDADAVFDLVERELPRIVFAPAAFANVEACERDPAGAHAVNVDGTRNLARAAARVGALLVAFSSDYVFDGQAGPYREESAPAPLSEYGRQKLALERLAGADGPALVVRTTVVYGWERQGKNFVAGLVRALREGRAVRAPVDLLGSPTYAPNLADAVVALAHAGRTGLLHVVGPRVVSRYQFALAAADAFGLDRGLIVPVETAALGQVATRPLRAGMVAERAQALLPFPLLDHTAGLAAMAAAEPATLKEVA